MYEPIAIIGTSCRFPGAANSPSKLWELLKTPRELVKEFPPERLNAANFYNENGERHGFTNVQRKSYLLEEDIRQFDAAFFHINPKEAADMDPQQRVLLEAVYEAFESAGLSLADVDGSQTSVHVGSMADDHAYIQSRDPDTLGSHAATGICQTFLSNRISYAFNLQGASISLNTACSGSLVALHMAIQGLHRGEASQAVVAGCNLLMDPLWYIMESSMHMLSPTSHSSMWDKDANGYARGEGCAAVVLKTLSQAIRDGDHIESIIRGSGVNSDGRTNGITMPSPTAQTALIRQTYREAGLDPLTDRCQYFECHGTGTQAGDPVEAQAIRDAFFPNVDEKKDDVLYCGSIKTIIGHLEGCAGLAGVIKTSLAIQNKMIPPNLHFHTLNPKVEPFYTNLRVPTSLVPWPETNDGPRRASVNSFGFGGTNAHAIIESFDPSHHLSSPPSSFVDVLTDEQSEPATGSHLVGPFVFSARSRVSLVNWLKEMLVHIGENSSLDLESLSHHLATKRSVFPYRLAIPTATNRDDLFKKLEDQINALSTSTSDTRAGSATKAKVLGIFTGQGAQAPQMGYSLLEHCKVFRDSIKECELALQTVSDPPTWSLKEELEAGAATSKISQAKFSQPLCTAVQIGLVDLLRASGIRFAAVVGHSSGEIGAAYAAGLLTRRDAMGIAYYRGQVAHLAKGVDGQSGSMMAAGMSFDDAHAECSEPQFHGRIGVAASNAPSSVTLSGDSDAINEMKEHLEKKNGIQARLLQVDTAYHSHHMLACSEAYLEYLRQLDVHIQTPPSGHECHWYSSVRANTDIIANVSEYGLEGQYWLDNMVQPVLFSEAVKMAVQQGGTEKFTAAIEVGPHPALRGPASQTLKQAVDYSVLYTGCIARGKDGVETMLEMLSAIWSLAPSLIDFAGWRSAFGLTAQPQALKNLPPYAWDHDQLHWRESRVGHNYRLGKDPIHDLLGRPWNDSRYEKTWRNIFHLSEMPWVKGHVFQDQILFPAAGYISMAVDAAKSLVKGRPIKSVEVRDMSIPTALVIGERDEVEVLFTIRSTVLPDSVQDGSTLESEFVCYSYPDHRNADRTCHGQLLIHLGEPQQGDLAPTAISQVELAKFNVDRFYRSMSAIGFGYNGVFRAIKSLNKSWGHAKAVASWSSDDIRLGCTLHPAVLDIALQAALSTFVSTAEGSMPSPYLPVGINRLIIDPNENYQGLNESVDIEIEAYLTSLGLGKVMETDINISTQVGDRNRSCGIQVEGVAFQAISEQQPSEDRNIMAKTVWGVDVAYGLVSQTNAETEEEESIYSPEDYERVALYYMQSLKRSVEGKDIAESKPHYQLLVDHVKSTLAKVQERNHPFLQKEWLNDTSANIDDLFMRDPNDVDMVILKSSGERNLSILESNGELNNDVLDDLKRSIHQTKSFVGSNTHIAELVRNISHKYPRCNILEINAGDSNTTSTVLGSVGDAYESYTCAAGSDSVLNQLKEKLKLDDTSKVSFKIFDIETDAESQGLAVGSYDVIIATNVFNASRKLSDVVQNARNLLRTGGFLIVLELTGASLRPIVTLGALESWWAGAEDGRKSGPGITTRAWDKLLQQTQFSGIDSISHDQSNISMHGYSVFATQAIDDRLDILRDPLTSLELIPSTPVVIIGGNTNRVSKLVQRVQRILRSWTSDIQAFDSFDLVESSKIPSGSSVICLQDLDSPLFSSPPTPDELENLKEIVGTSQNVLWVTSGRLLDNPLANIMVGIGRSLRLEFTHVNLHFLDFDGQETWDVQILIAQFLRLLFTSSTNMTEGMLWVEEPETVVRDSQLTIGRIMPDHVANEVYNAKRRRIVKPIGPSEPIEIAKDAESSKQLLVSSDPVEISEGLAPVQVRLSVALTAGDGSSRILSYGSLNDKDQTATLALSDIDSSLVTTEKDFDIWPLPLQDFDAKCLADLASFLIASHIISTLPSHGSTLVCGASDRLAKAFNCLVADSQREVLFVELTNKTKAERPGWIYIHPQNTSRFVHKIIPEGPTTLVCLATKDFDALLPCLPANCTPQRFNPHSISQQSVREALVAYQKYQEEFALIPEPRVINIKDVSQSQPDTGILSTVTNWDRDEPIGALVRGLEPRKLLSSNKTYVLVGMASELGQSLTYFMVRGGARYIVLASRNPKEGQHWIEDLRATGVVIRLLKMDVTDRSQVQQGISTIRREMPEIGGVANAALVMEAGVFANLSAESLARQLKPKVFGTVNLDEEFKKDNLDFFLTFGSIATVIGNAGQAMYHAGNIFMQGLVAKRRKRGQAASVLNFGMLTDVGFVARSDRDTGSNIEGQLRTELSAPLSESDFHHLILQGIAAGNPSSPSGEVIMGFEVYIDQGEESRPPWADKAFLSHMIRVSKASKDEQSDAPSSAQQWNVVLEEATTVSEAIPAITALLSAKIESMIHISLDSIHSDEPISHLGIDSINAIEIRRWIREKLRADVSMLKILGRDSSCSIIQNIAEQYIKKRAAAKKRVAKKSAAAPKGPATTQSAGNPTLNKPKVAPIEPLSKVASVPVLPGKAYRQNESSTRLENGLEIIRSEGLSFEQAGYFYLKTFSDEPKSFNLAFKYRIKGELNANRFTRAFDKTILQHESMRTCFYADPESTKIRQHVAKRINVPRLSYMSSTKETAEKDGKTALDSLMQHEFALEQGDTFRAVLVSHAPDLHSLAIAFHNIAIDTMSIIYFLRDIGLAYQFLPMTPNPGSFIDYTRQQAEDFKSGRMDASIDYWKKHLDPLPEALPLLPLAKVKNRQGRRTYGRCYLERELSSEFAQKVTEISQAHNVTEMQFYLSALQILLCQVLRVKDVCVGITYTGRDPMSKYGETLGHMANILPIHFRGCLDKSFPELLVNTMELLLSGLDNAQVPFAALLEKVGNGQHHGNMPLFQVAFDYRVHESVHSRFSDCTMVMDDTRYTTLYDLTLDIHQSETGGHVVKIILTDDYYTMESTELMMESFFSVLESAMKDSSGAAKDYKCFSDSQLQQATSVGRGPEIKYSWPDSLIERLEEVTATFPDAIAIKDGDVTITYSELKARVGRYARFFLDTEATVGSLIAVHCKPSIDLYTTILAILHIGAVYVPIDASSPVSRRRDILAVCKPHMLVYHAPTASCSLEDVENSGCKSLNLSEQDAKSTGDIVVPERHRSTASDTKYILFTSGSTGTPKGITLTERGNMNNAAYMNDTFGFEKIKVLQQTSMGFDLGLGQMYLAFTNGGTLVAVPVEARGDPETLSRMIYDEKIELTMGTPSEYLPLVTYCQETLQQCPWWRIAITAGEALPERLVYALRDLKLPNITLSDAYGPAEAYIVTAAHFPLHSGTIDEAAMKLMGTIGKAVPNTSIYVTNENDGTPLPPGIEGEICISGCGVANGYFDPSLNQGKFIKDEFAPLYYLERSYNGIYKSGDRGILRPDGSIKYLGRAQEDRNVIKLRGLRIDLQEVTGAILEAAEDDLADVAVTVRGNETQFLVSHVTFKPGHHLEQTQLMSIVQALPLPRYMIPSVVVPIERLPVTSNGKLDVRALDAMPLPVQSAQNDAVGQMSEAEKNLRQLWIDVIGEVAETMDINLDSDFFAVGGNSLLLVHLLNAVKVKAGIRIPLPLLRQASTIRTMSAVIEKERSKLVKAG